MLIGTSSAVACAVLPSLQTSSCPLTSLPVPDRRKSSRLCEAFPLVVRGLNRFGEPFERRTFLVNLSAGGMYFSLSDEISLGAEVYAVVELCSASRRSRSSARVAVQGVVVRVEPWMDGTHGFGLKFTKHQVF
jgi:hypothetical protein